MEVRNQFFTRLSELRVAGSLKLAVCATSLFAMLGASPAVAQYGANPYAQAPRQAASPYGYPSTMGQTRSSTRYHQPQTSAYSQSTPYANGYGQAGYGQQNQSRPGYGAAVAQTQQGHASLYQRGASFYDPTGASSPDTLPPPVEPQLQLPGQMKQHTPQANSTYSDQLWSGGGCADGSCGTCDVGCDPCGCTPWYVGVYALSMTRDLPNRVWTSFETGNNPNQLTNTQDVDADWTGGGEIVIGRCLPCLCGWGAELRYWQLGDMDSYNSTTHASSVSTPLDVNGIEFGATNASAFFDGADEHRLWRRNEFYNLEVNMVNNAFGRGACGCDSNRWQVGGLFGFRYMRFNEDLRFGALASGGSWNTSTDQAYLEDNIENQLFGFQAGANIRRNFCRNWAFTCTPKVGIFANRIDNRFHAYRGDGLAATPTAASGVTGTYPVNGSSDNLSFMLEVDLGLAWQVTCRWEVAFGYRVMALTGMGLADNQFAPFAVDIPELADIDTNGQLILHGGYAGVTYRF